MCRIKSFHPVFFLAVFAAILALGIAFSPSAQTGAQPQAGTGSTPPSATPSAAPASPAQQPEAPKYVLKSQVPLVVLDVVVTDKKGHPVHGLKQSDFTVTEKGQEMTIQSFEEHRADQVQPAAPPPTQKELGTNVFTNLTYNPNNGPLNILLMDALNTPMKDQTYVRQQMLKYLKSLPEGTRIAIFGLSTRLYILQGFTSDPAILKAVLSGKKGTPYSSPLINSAVENEVQQDSLDMQISAMGNDPSAPQMQADMQQFMAQEASNEITLRVQYTLGAMNDMAHYLAGLPGRKNLIWFSAAFPINIMPDGDLENPFGPMMDYADDAKKTADLLARAQVAVYPVDARGLFSDPSQGADVSGHSTTSPQRQSAQVNSFFTQTTAEHSSMQLMAEQTGGKVYANTNDLKAAVQDAVNQGSNYYTLTYTPINREWDDSYRNMRVKLDQPGVELFYRRGYFAEDPNAGRKHGEGAKVLPVSVMQSAMTRGGPDPTEILFKVKIVPSAANDDALLPSNHPNPKMKLKPPFRRYTVFYGPSLRRVVFKTTPDSKYQASIEFVTNLYNPDGELVNMTYTQFNPNLPAEKYKDLMQRGLMLYQQIDVPLKGEYFLRMGVHDLSSDRVGAVEVPLAAIRPESMPAAGSAPAASPAAPQK